MSNSLRFPSRGVKTAQHPTIALRERRRWESRLTQDDEAVLDTVRNLHPRQRGEFDGHVVGQLNPARS